MELKHLKRTVGDEREILEASRVRLENALIARTLIQEVAEQVQRTAHAQLAGVVSRCLKAVFGEDAYELRIRFVQRRGKTEAELVLARGELVLDEPVDACGGGVIDVASFALRLAALILSQPRKRKWLILDESFKHLSQEYRPRVRELLEKLSKELGIQITLVTHSQELVVGEELCL